MSETTPGETPVERRLREMREAVDGYGRMAMDVSVEDEAAIDAGREALALLRRVRALRGMRESAWVKWTQETDALLARCEGDR